MSSAKLAKEQTTQDKVSVHISKETGGAYADTREVIMSELARIRNEIAHKADSNDKICSTDTHTTNTGK